MQTMRHVRIGIQTTEGVALSPPLDFVTASCECQKVRRAGLRAGLVLDDAGYRQQAAQLAGLGLVPPAGLLGDEHSVSSFKFQVPSFKAPAASDETYRELAEPIGTLGLAVLGWTCLRIVAGRLVRRAWQWLWTNIFVLP